MDKVVLYKIINNHQEWLLNNGEKGECADLSYADLIEANLSHVHLIEADLSHVNLRGADLRYADLRGADLRGADLNHADLREADLRGANLDFSTLPLWCGGLDVHIDDRQATQILYHLLRNIKYSKNTSSSMKNICKIESLINKANEFHRKDECGKITFD